MIEQIMVPKEDILLIPETVNCLDALEILEENNLRNAPVVDSTEQLFRGNIYKYHIYKEAFHHGKEHLKSKRVTSFLKNTTRVVHLNDSIYQLIFSIRDLPYICILNENNNFVGIVYHNHLLDFLAQAWGANDRMHMLKIDLTPGLRSLDQLTRIILKYIEPKTFQLFQETDFNTSKHLFVVIGPEVNRVQINRLILKLRQKQYPLTEYHW
ncbi:CBS domain-containing protein [Aerococcaceae bacterium DSM 111020]|nr:CBS domain-containing protein [Aerococcaceae bacterium DSM 111020]